jgi:hypothetical protein
VRYAFGHPGYRPDSEIVGPAFVGLASSELAATGDAYIPDGQSEDVSDTQVFDLINGSWQLTDTLPGVNPPTTIGNRVALLMDTWTEPGDVGSLFTRDASRAWTVKHTLLTDEIFTTHRLSFGQDIVIRGGRAFTHADRQAVKS